MAANLALALQDLYSKNTGPLTTLPTIKGANKGCIQKSHFHHPFLPHFILFRGGDAQLPSPFTRNSLCRVPVSGEMDLLSGKVVFVNEVLFLDDEVVYDLNDKYG